MARTPAQRVFIEEIKVGEFAGYYGVFVGCECRVYTPSWADAVEQQQALQRHEWREYDLAAKTEVA